MSSASNSASRARAASSAPSSARDLTTVVSTASGVAVAAMVVLLGVVVVVGSGVRAEGQKRGAPGEARAEGGQQHVARVGKTAVGTRAARGRSGSWPRTCCRSRR